jgi:hypothetical protein
VTEAGVRVNLAIYFATGLNSRHTFARRRALNRYMVAYHCGFDDGEPN